MKYKVGDRVRIKSLEWYNENKKNSFKNLSISFTHEMSKFCGKIVTIEEITEDAEYHIKEDYWRFFWTDEMIEGLVEDIITTNEQLFEPSNISLEKEMEWNLPEGYQFVDENGNIINATKIVLEKKNVLEKKSPKTDDIIKWLREHDMTKYIGVIYSGMCSITFDTEGLIKDFLKTVEDNE